MTLIMSMILSMNIMLMFINHPLSMGMLLIMQTLMISMMAGMTTNTMWMSYILMISMLSGMLVLFIYMSSVASNEKFKNNIKMWMMTITTMLTGMTLTKTEEKMILKNTQPMPEINEIFFLNKMFNMENMYMIIMLVMYLLLTMIVSTHLVNITEGPMRIKMYE